MSRIRILLAGMPRLLEDIVEHMLNVQSDMHVVGTVVPHGAAAAALVEALADTPADVVVLGLSEEAEASTYDALLFANPRLRLLAVVGDGRGAFLYELQPSRVPLGVVSPEALVDVIRAAPTPGVS